MNGDSSALSALVGTVVDGRYRIDRLLGEGGMGAVYATTDLRLEKPVAIKLISRELAANPEALARFHREAKVTSALGHPHIVQVLDFSVTPTGEPFIVMEFLDGEDLEHRIRRDGRLSAKDTLAMAKQVASALMAAHEKGIIHRDLKPANIYLLHAAGANDFVKVLDFGISKITSSSTRLTRTTAIVGTPNYMSPEQAEARNDDIDGRTDQWALACIVWECLTGELLFPGDNAMSVLLQIVNKPPRPFPVKLPDFGDRLHAVLMRGLARDKNDRFASVNDFAVALENAVAGLPAMASAPGTVRASKTAVEDPTPRSPALLSTLTKSARETFTEPADTPPTRPRAWVRAALIGTVVLVVAAAVLLLRPKAAPELVKVGPRATAAAPAVPQVPQPAVLPEPTPSHEPRAVAVPPAAAAPATPPVAAPPAPNTGKTGKTGQRSSTRPEHRAGEPPRRSSGTESEHPQRPAPPPSKESQDKWRLD